jgi:hypothetical protein
VLESAAVYVPLTVVLELDWVMRGFYELAPAPFCDAIEHLHTPSFRGPEPGTNGPTARNPSFW